MGGNLYHVKAEEFNRKQASCLYTIREQVQPDDTDG